MGFSPVTPNLQVAGTGCSGEEDTNFAVPVEPAELPRTLCWKGKQSLDSDTGNGILAPEDDFLK